MLERFHNFSMACALVLASGCLGAFVRSIQRSRGGRVPVHRVVLGELPLLVYIWGLALSLMISDLPGKVQLMTTTSIIVGGWGLWRILSYTRKREIFERLTILEELRQATQAIAQAQLQVMSNMERAKYLRVQPEPPATQRPSRYKRSPVI